MSDCREYTVDVLKAFKCEHTLAALEAYVALRRSLVIPDNMSEGAMIALQRRVREASEKYSDSEGVANAAMNKVLRAYVEYLSQIMWERDHVG